MAAPRDSETVLYFAGRPVAILRLTPSSSDLKYLTTDHLGTPILATADTGALVWQGGFEPFGADWNGAGAAGVFLRFSGQWEDGLWEGGELESGLCYNLHRWYLTSAGRYLRPDPEWIDGLMLEQENFSALGLYLYASNRPTAEIDPDGLMAIKYHRSCRKLSESQRRALEEAVNDASQYFPFTPQCQQRMPEKLTLRCESCGDNCGRQFGRTICVNIGKVENGRCGSGPECLASTVLHEIVHSCGESERESYACEKRFYSKTCQSQTPEKHRPTYECPNPCGS